MKKLAAGILAHVDAGKTTLAEALLYQAGILRKLGRVDEKNSFLDTFELERKRGITIFSKEARIPSKEGELILLDTPGHVDFSAEMERVLQVLDFAVLVINGTDGVQAQTRTLWRLLDAYQVPVFLFVNKMDLPGTDAQALCGRLNRELQEGCLDFQQGEEQLWEEAAACDEEALEEYVETGRLSRESVRRLIAERKIFPCYFGSALKLLQTEEFLQGIWQYGSERLLSRGGNKTFREVGITLGETREEVARKQEEDKKEEGIPQREIREDREENRGAGREKSGVGFGAKIFKVTRDERGSRITHVRVTEGALSPREAVTYRDEEGNIRTEKIHQIRVYSGDRYECIKEAKAGEICGLTGLSGTRAGKGLGWEEEEAPPFLEPVLKYRVEPEEPDKIHEVLQAFKKLQEEEPTLMVEWCGETQEIYVRLMGEIQAEILKLWIQEKYGLAVEFSRGTILYKETIEEEVIGRGHFEPLRHYAEIHLKLTPLPAGRGVEVTTECDEEMLEGHWQKLVLRVIKEEPVKGVLTGAEVTDVRVTLLAGRTHLKHTVGGDVREATRRALRQGLMKARTVLLEPYYSILIESPAENVGKILTDLTRRGADLLPLEQEEETVKIRGKAPVFAMDQYAREVAAFTGGRGSCSLTISGYGPCRNTEQIVEMEGYMPEKDAEWTAGSIFCCQGAGISVSWREADEKMHIRYEEGVNGEKKTADTRQKRGGRTAGSGDITQKEIDEILLRTYGSGSVRERRRAPVSVGADFSHESAQEYLLVDGYNVIFAWKGLKELAKEDMNAARGKLLDILSDYQGYRGIPVIAVFDAYRVEGTATKVEKYHNIFVVYTKEAETADQYIEKTVHRAGRKHHVTVVTSDRIEQIIIQGQGGTLISSREFLEEILRIKKEAQVHQKDRRSDKTYLFDGVDEELADQVELVRLGKKQQIE